VFWKVMALRVGRESIGDGEEWRREKHAGCVCSVGSRGERHLRNETESVWRCRNRVETSFCADLGDRNPGPVVTQLIASAHELSQAAVAVPAGRTPIRRI